MKTAKQTALEIREALGNGLRFDPCLVTGKSLIEKLVELVQEDARLQGMTDAAQIVHDEGLFQMSESILAARDGAKNPLPV